MPLRHAPHTLTPASCQRWISYLALPLGLPALILCLSQSLLPLSAKTRPAAALESGYVPALAAADRFLQTWQAADVENGMALLTTHAKEAANRNVIERFFSNPEPSGYEIERGKLVKRGRYEFPVVLVTVASKSIRVRRRISNLVIVNTGDNEWAVDKLP